MKIPKCSKCENERWVTHLDHDGLSCVNHVTPVLVLSTFELIKASKQKDFKCSKCGLIGRGDPEDYFANEEIEHFLGGCEGSLEPFNKPYNPALEQLICPEPRMNGVIEALTPSGLTIPPPDPRGRRDPINCTEPMVKRKWWQIDIFGPRGPGRYCKLCRPLRAFEYRY